MQNSVILHLIKILSQRQIEIVPAEKCDILFLGPYKPNSLKGKIYSSIKKKFPRLEDTFNRFNMKILNRKFQPIKIFHSHENYPFPDFEYDFSITNHLGMNSEKNLRFPLWKDLIDWKHLGIIRNTNKFIKRFDNFYNIRSLMLPQGENFLKKERKICLLSSHLNEPRKSMYFNLSKYFTVDGYGSFFNKDVKHHNLSPNSKKEILSKYAFNLCPENSLYPGYYTEKVPEAFLGKSLPLAWADNNINIDFNEKSFVNLLNYSKDNYFEISNLLKDENFLKQFTTEPLLLKEPNLNEEINFIKKIISSI